MDLSQHSFKVGGKHVKLTNAEYQFLQLLLANPDRIFPREQILQTIGSFRGYKSDHLVDWNASRLRKKIREAGGPNVISVVRSVGFRLGAPSDEELAPAEVSALVSKTETGEFAQQTALLKVDIYIVRSFVWTNFLTTYQSLLTE